MKQYEDTNYFITEDGKILNKSKNRFLKLYLNNWGYLWTKLGRKNGNGKQVHRLVAQTYVPNPENKPQVNHINGIKTDNRVENLEWVTAKENVNHSYKIGLKTIDKGEKHSQSRITEKDVLEIRASDLSNKELELIYKVKANYIASIKRRVYWKHI